MEAPFSVRGLCDIIGNAVDFITLYPGTNLVPAPPRFTFGTFNAELAAGYYRNTHLWAIGVYRLHGFEVVGPYGICKNGELFASHEANIHPKHIKDLVAEFGPPTLARPRRFLAGPVAMITGPGYGVYGHWLSDFLPKLWSLQAGGYDVRRLRYLIPANTPRFGLEWMQLLGIPSENIILFDPVNEVVWIEELLVPTTYHNGVRTTTLLRDAAAFLLSLIADHTGEPTGTTADQRIFLSRSRAPQTRALLNRVRVEEIAVAAGLELVYPEAMPLRDQVKLFRSAKMIVGEYGSALHGSLFSLPGTTVCALRGSLPHPGFIQSGFGQALEQPTGYVFGAPVDESGDGRFFISETHFAECLRTLLTATGFERI